VVKTPFWIKCILLIISVGVLVVVVLWGVSLASTAVSGWLENHPYETAAIGAVIILSVVAILWRIFLWREED
jgi:hypothetical protein